MSAFYLTGLSIYIYILLRKQLGLTSLLLRSSSTAPPVPSHSSAVARSLSSNLILVNYFNVNYSTTPSNDQSQTRMGTPPLRVVLGDVDIYSPRHVVPGRPWAERIDPAGRFPGNGNLRRPRDKFRLETYLHLQTSGRQAMATLSVILSSKTICWFSSGTIHFQPSLPSSSNPVTARTEHFA